MWVPGVDLALTTLYQLSYREVVEERVAFWVDEG